MLDKMSQTEQLSYLNLRLFCNWVVHNEITKSNTGLRILAEINDALVKIKNSTNSKDIQSMISLAISYPILRKQLKLFLDNIGVDEILVDDNNLWANFITNLIEIIRDVPLSFPPLSELSATQEKIYDQITQNPIVPGGGVISIMISQINYDEIGVKGMGNQICILIKTVDTTTTVIPMLIDVRL